MNTALVAPPINLSVQQNAFETSRAWVLVSVTILAYDYLLTLPSEIHFFWTRARVSFPVVLFYICRYGSLVGHVPVVYAAFAEIGAEGCDRWEYYHELFTGISSLLVSALLVVRVYALYECSRSVLILLVGALVCSSVGSYVLTSLSELQSGAQYELVDPRLLVRGDCKIILGVVEGYYNAGAWACILAFDTLAFALTLRRTLAVHRLVRVRRGLFWLMMRDGIVYFAILVALYLVNIVTLLLCTPDYKGLLITFTNALAYVLASRLMLNIRAAVFCTVEKKNWWHGCGDGVEDEENSVHWDAECQEEDDGSRHGELHKPLLSPVVFGVQVAAAGAEGEGNVTETVVETGSCA